MSVLDTETYEEWRKAAEFVTAHGSQVRMALLSRREYFVKYATDTRRAHLAGDLSDPAPEGHILVMDNNGLKQAALLFKQEAESVTRALKAYDDAAGDDYEHDYDIEWEVEW